MLSFFSKAVILSEARRGFMRRAQSKDLRFGTLALSTRKDRARKKAVPDH
jgi:hypothetical protein